MPFASTQNTPSLIHDIAGQSSSRFSRSSRSRKRRRRSSATAPPPGRWRARGRRSRPCFWRGTWGRASRCSCSVWSLWAPARGSACRGRRARRRSEVGSSLFQRLNKFMFDCRPIFYTEGVIWQLLITFLCGWQLGALEISFDTWQFMVEASLPCLIKIRWHWFHI